MRQPLISIWILLALACCIWVDESAQAQTANEKLTFDSTMMLQGPQLSPRQSHPILIQFWASWCNRCSSMFAEVAQFAWTTPNLKYVAVSIDDNAEVARSYLKRHATLLAPLKDAAFLLDTGGVLAKRYEITSVPEIIIVDANGKMIARNKGHATKAQLFRMAKQIETARKGATH